MLKTTCICDICGAENALSYKTLVFSKYHADSRLTPIQTEIDLCDNCACKATNIRKTENGMVMQASSVTPFLDQIKDFCHSEIYYIEHNPEPNSAYCKGELEAYKTILSKAKLLGNILAGTKESPTKSAEYSIAMQNSDCKLVYKHDSEGYCSEGKFVKEN